MTFTALSVGCADFSRGADLPLGVGSTTGLAHTALQTLQEAHRRVSRSVVVLVAVASLGLAWFGLVWLGLAWLGMAWLGGGGVLLA